MRKYRTLRGVWGFGFGHSPGGYWHIQFGPWVITTEPDWYAERWSVTHDKH